MTIELVKKPWVRIFSRPIIDLSVMQEFAEDHQLQDILLDENSPLSKLHDQLHYPPNSDGDALSEFAGRFCYRSWAKGRESSEYIANILTEKHGNVLAHSHYSFIITGVSRSLTHELIRHHVGTNPSQESQRYVTAEGGEIEVVGYRATRAVVPPLILTLADKYPNVLEEFGSGVEMSLGLYHATLGALKKEFEGSATINKKRLNEAARAFLPNATETRLVWTMNIRSARWMIEQRGSEHADLEIRRLAVEIGKLMQLEAPLSFQDMELYTAEDGLEAVRMLNSKV